MRELYAYSYNEDDDYIYTGTSNYAAVGLSGALIDKDEITIYIQIHTTYIQNTIV